MLAFSAPARFLCGFVLTAAVFACGGDTSEAGTIDHETFVATYVELRASALRNDPREITDSARARILEEHGTTEDELLMFAEVHGRDVAYMRDLWDEVEGRLDAIGPTMDVAGTR